MSEEGATDLAHDRFDAAGAARHSIARAKWPLMFISPILLFVNVIIPAFDGELLLASIMAGFWASCLGVWVAYCVWRAHRQHRRRRARAAYEQAALRAGVPSELADVSRFARVRHALSGSVEPVLAALLPGAVISIIAMLWGNFWPGLALAVGASLAVLCAGGALTLRDALRDDDESLHAARAEAAYREVVRAGADLGGALSVEVESAGGDLSVTADAGALESCEEVTLDLEAATHDASAADGAVLAFEGEAAEESFARSTRHDRKGR